MTAGSDRASLETSGQGRFRPKQRQSLKKVSAALVGTGGPYSTIIDETAAEAPAGPLAGHLLAVKDVFAIAGYPLRAGSRSRGDQPCAVRDAAIVAQLRELGAQLVGITTTHELAYGVTGINAYEGTPDNPLYRGHIPGGSSSGSAVAIAEGSATLACGTDTGGSVRIPAALCGVVGFKPQQGTYSTAGVLPLAPTLDHVGLLAATVSDVREVHRQLVRTDGHESGPLRVGVEVADGEGASPVVRARLDAVLNELPRRGVDVVTVDWPEPGESYSVSSTILMVEAASLYADDAAANPSNYGDDVRDRLVAGRAIPEKRYRCALVRRADIRANALRALERVDAMVGPTVPITAPTRHAAAAPSLGATLVRHTRLANLCGLAALSVPIPGTPPVGLQIVARSNSHALDAALFLEGIMAEAS